MANDNFPRGLVPLRLKPDGAHYYRVSSGADTFLGEPVQLHTTGYVVGASIAGVAYYLGVAIGFAGPDKASIANDDPFLDVSDLAPLASGLPTGDRFVLVADDPDQEFYIQEDTGGTALALADIGAAIDGLYRGSSGTARAGSADTGWASLELDASAVVTTTAAVLQLLGLHETMNSDGTRNAVGDYAKWVVKILHHQKRGTAAQTAEGPIV